MGLRSFGREGPDRLHHSKPCRRGHRSASIRHGRFGANLWTERMRRDSWARFFHRTRRSLAMTRILLALAALALLTQCADDSARRLAAGQVSTSTADAGAAAQLISRHRAAHGLGPVSVDARPNQAAPAQARAVAQARTLSHRAVASRLASFGIGRARAPTPAPR